MEWISAIKQLPEAWLTVRVKAANLRSDFTFTVLGPDGEYVGFYDDDDRKWLCYSGSINSLNLCDCDVTEWQPLTFPPENGESK
jgi:hypothetical protein